VCEVTGPPFNIRKLGPGVLGELRMSENEYRRLKDGQCGLCIACAHVIRVGVEPLAAGVVCPACGQPEVFGSEFLGELQLVGVINVEDDLTLLSWDELDDQDDRWEEVTGYEDGEHFQG
jgi:hypothetical protein